jgi:hypothetical protein
VAGPKKEAGRQARVEKQRQVCQNLQTGKQEDAEVGGQKAEASSKRQAEVGR